MPDAPAPSAPTTTAAPNPIDALLELGRRARNAESPTALRFIAVNDTHLLAPYQQSALWLRERGVVALSGLTEVEANAPYVQWLGRVFAYLGAEKRPLGEIKLTELPAALANDWAEWLPPHAVWVPFAAAGHAVATGGLIYARPIPWRPVDLRLLDESVGAWFCAWRALDRPSLWRRLDAGVRRLPATIKRRPVLWSLAALLLLCWPVRLSVLAPGELVPARPIAIRAPLEGIIKAFAVKTNQPVTVGQPLFTYDDLERSSKLEVALEQLRTAEAEERLYSQQALTDMKARGLLAAARGTLEQRKIEVEFLRSQLALSTVTAPEAGLAFVDDVAEWIGRPVVAGQRIMRLARLEEVEIEAWLPVGDAIVLPAGATTQLYLTASPLQAVKGQVHTVSYEAVPRPDGSYAYRVRATLAAATEHRVGLKGTVRLNGRRVPLVYWMFRRPWAAVREFVGR